MGKGKGGRSRDWEGEWDGAGAQFREWARLLT